MRFEATEHIALGVKDRGAAERFYTQVMGFEAVERREDWTRIDAGKLQLYLCDDDMALCFAVTVDDPETAASHMVHYGATRLFESDGEVFVRDPMGTNWCLSPRASSAE